MFEASARPRRKRLSWESRCAVVAAIEVGVSPPLAAASGGCSRATAYRLWKRYLEGGWSALRDRPSTPRRQPRRLDEEAERLIIAARTRSGWGPLRLSGLLPYPASTIGKVLRRSGISRLPRPAGEPRCARRYERERAGELLHVDTKKLGRFWTPGKRVLGDDVGNRSRHAGWQYLHVAIDDHSRLLYAELLPSERADDCCRFLARAVSAFRAHGLRVEQVLTDNAFAYRKTRWRRLCAELAIEPIYTRPRRPRTNGKAERVIQTLLREWAYARSYPNSAARARTLTSYLRWYNRRRPHSSLGGRPPQSRVSHLCGHDS